MAKFWFSRQGLVTLLKGIAAFAVIIVLLGLALFAYYRKDLDQISPSTLAQRVKTTVTTYYDRNGKVLWEDKGSGDYTLVVDPKTIAPCMGKATIAIEDKDFYKHGGVSISGILRALISNSQGNSAQGGSTLTQQLVKQVFFKDEAAQRGLAGIPGKIKEMILAVEVERMYSRTRFSVCTSTSLHMAVAATVLNLPHRPTSTSPQKTSHSLNARCSLLFRTSPDSMTRIISQVMTHCLLDNAGSSITWST